jgi:hypothetical protein
VAEKAVLVAEKAMLDGEVAVKERTCGQFDSEYLNHTEQKRNKNKIKFPSL